MESDARRHDEPLSFRQLVEEHKKRIYHLALDLTGSHQDAEDLSQEVFIKAHEALEDFRGEASVFSWLHRITVNTYLNSQRGKENELTKFWGDIGGWRERRSEAPEPDHRAERDVMQQHIDAAMSVLSPRERTAFVLRQYSDRTIREVAEEMDVAEGTVKSFLYRATQKLRKALAPLRDDASSHSQR